MESGYRPFNGALGFYVVEERVRTTSMTPCQQKVRSKGGLFAMRAVGIELKERLTLSDFLVMLLK